MYKIWVSAFLVLGLSSALSGCVLAPQVIQLNESVAIVPAAQSVNRGALIRVIDERDVERADYLGSRGGRISENSPLLAQDGLTVLLTKRLQDSVAQLGYGVESPLEPLKVQLVINKFRYECNDGFMVNDCSVRIKFDVTVIDGETTFTKPYGLSESRRVAAAPVKEYNEEWLNTVLDRLWVYIFNDPDLREFLGV